MQFDLTEGMKTKINKKLKFLKKEKRISMKEILNITINKKKKNKLNFLNQTFVINERVSFCDTFSRYVIAVCFCDKLS